MGCFNPCRSVGNKVIGIGTYDYSNAIYIV